MVQELLEKELTSEDVDGMWKTLIEERDDYDNTERSMLAGLRQMIAEKESRPKDTSGTRMVFTSPKEQVEVQKPKKTSTSLKSKFFKYLKDLKKRSKWQELRVATLCQACGGSPEDPYVTSCYHIFCKECLNELAYQAAIQGHDQTTCGKCGEIFTQSMSCGGLKELEVRDLSNSVFQPNKDKTPVQKPFKLSMEYVDSKDGLVLSSKMIAVRDQLHTWLQEEPDGKIIVFTEWLMVYVP